MSLSLILISCSSNKQIKEAAKDIGVAQARVNLPPLPEDCRKKEPHAAVKVGDEKWSVLQRERDALERSWKRTDRCAGFYDGVKKEMK